MATTKDTKIKRLQKEATQRVAKHCASARRRKAFLLASKTGDVEYIYGVVFSTDEDDIIDLLDDSSEAVDAFLQKAIEDAFPKA